MQTATNKKMFDFRIQFEQVMQDADNYIPTLDNDYDLVVFGAGDSEFEAFLSAKEELSKACDDSDFYPLFVRAFDKMPNSCFDNHSVYYEFQETEFYSYVPQVICVIHASVE